MKSFISIEINVHKRIMEFRFHWNLSFQMLWFYKFFVVVVGRFMEIQWTGVNNSHQISQYSNHSTITKWLSF